MNSRLLLIALLSAAPLAAQSAPAAADPWASLSLPRTRTPTPTTSAITVEDLKSRLYRFADDSMQGRFLGTPGNAKGAEYIASELRRIGLEPGGENGTYFQTLPWMVRSLDATSTLTVDGKSFSAWTDFVPRDQGPGQHAVENTPIVYAGDFADVEGRLKPADAAGKVIIVTFSGTVPGNPPRTPNRGQVNTLYPEAAGMLVVSRDEMPEQSIMGYRQPSQYLKDGDFPAVPSYVYITRAMAEAILGGPLAAAKAGAMGKQITGAIRWKDDPAPVPARNVIGILRGSDPKLKATYVAIGAHNDHIGTDMPVANDSMYVLNHLFRKQGADDAGAELTAEQQAQVNAALVDIRKNTNGASARPDGIYNGADDDGSGSMGVLEIAEWYASRAHPKRSVIFVWHVGEELGLFGSQYFTDHPTVPRDSIIAQLNVDMIGRGGTDDVTGATLSGQLIHGGPDYVQLIGSRRVSTQLGDWAEVENKEGNHRLQFDYSLDANGHPQNIYCRSDHYEYARYSIPIIFFTTGGHADYHQVTDEPQHIDYEHYARVTKFIGALGQRVANSAARPVIDHPVADPKGACRQ